MFTQGGFKMTTLYVLIDRVKRILVLIIMLLLATILSCILNPHLPNHMQNSFIQTCEARSEGDVWRDFFRREFQKVIRNEFDGVRKLRDTRYDILSHNMWERNRWETDYRRMQVQGALAYNGGSVYYVSPRVAEVAEQIKQQIIADRLANGITNGISQHKVRYEYNSDVEIIRSLCSTPGAPYRIIRKILGSKAFYIQFDPSLLA